VGKGIFVSYRRKDTEGEASRLTEELRTALPDVPLFRDVEAISPGEDFVVALERALEECAVMLVLIGPIWLDVTDANGRRRLEDPHDWTRLEVATALRRGIRVIPVLCRGATLPTDADLPDDLDPLVRRQAVEVDNNRWRYDVDQLMDRLAQALGTRRRAPAEKAAAAAPARGGGWLKGAVITFAVIGALVVVGIASEFTGSTPADPEATGKALDLIARTAQEMQNQAGSGAPNRASVQNETAGTPAVAQPVVVQRASAVEIAGLWRAGPTEVWVIQQSGAELAVSAQDSGIELARGGGQIVGNAMQLMLNVRTPQLVAQVQCAGTVTQNGRMIVGSCAGPNGQSPIQLTR
jgi:hypothetical protein